MTFECAEALKEGTREVDEVDLSALAEGAAEAQPSKAGELSDFEAGVSGYVKEPFEDRTRIDKLARIMFNDARVRKICRLRALKNGVDIEEADDVLQRTMEVFFGKMLKKIKSHDATYAVVYAIANNVSKEVAREAYSLIVDHDSIDELRENGGDLRESDLAGREEEDQESLVDTRIIKERMARALLAAKQGVGTLEHTGVFDATSEMLPLVRAVPQSKRHAMNEQIVAKQAATASSTEKKVKELSAEQQELVDIIADLGIRNHDFAVALGIGLPRLSSYIYGRTASVPQAVMEMARQVHKEQKAHNDVLRKRFSRPMSEILSEWRNLLDAKTNEELAEHIGVTTMTIHRWNTDETRPDQTALVRYNAIVQQTANRKRRR